MNLVITQDMTGKFWVERLITKKYKRGTFRDYETIAGPFQTVDEAEFFKLSSRRTIISR